MRKIFPAAWLLFLFLFCSAGFAADSAGDSSTESLLAEYVAILKRIEAERAALEDERAQIAADRWKKALDDRLIDEFVVLVDRSMARLEAEEKRLEAERAWIEREKEKLIRAQGTPVRRATIEDPLIRAGLHEKIFRYWGN